ncbi:MAG: regulatory protein TetR [Acidimicrobiales bacterium]|nr:regulatory protein TetR [Acidimicrobiales bacterium]
MEPTTPEPREDVAERIARRTLASRAPDYPGEVRRLLDAGREVIRRCGTEARPRVADIVAAAGLSNDAFYRHFTSKDALVAAILEDGTERLRSYLDHQMAKEVTPEGKLRRWVEGVLSQAADDDVAATTLAVLWNADGLADGPAAARAPLATLLHQPFAALGSVNPELDASLAGHCVIGALSDFLWQRSRPTREEIEHVVAFCLAAVRPRNPRQ